MQVDIYDAGVRIAENKITQLFQIENKISTPGTNHQKSTGLYLILCKEFIERIKAQFRLKAKKQRI